AILSPLPPSRSPTVSSVLSHRESRRDGAARSGPATAVASPEPYRRALGSFACVPRVRARPGRLAVVVLLPDRARDRLQAAALDSPPPHPPALPADLPP